MRPLRFILTCVAHLKNKSLPFVLLLDVDDFNPRPDFTALPGPDKNELRKPCPEKIKVKAFYSIIVLKSKFLSIEKEGDDRLVLVALGPCTGGPVQYPVIRISKC